MRKHIKKKVFLLDKSRKYIRKIKNINFYPNPIVLVCYLVFFGGFSLQLLKEYFSSKVFEIYNYQDNFDFLILTNREQNYFYNYKMKHCLNQKIMFFFQNFNQIFSFFYKAKTLTLSPYLLNPLYLISKKSNLVLPFSWVSGFLREYPYSVSENKMSYKIYLNLTKKLFVCFFLQMAFLKKNKLCQL